MNCWFCNNFLTSQTWGISSTKIRHCKYPSCRKGYVVYVLVDEVIVKTQFKITIHSINSFKNYSITYFCNSKQIEVVQEIRVIDNDTNHLYVESKKVFTIPYESIILTPTNTESKLPTLITFS